MSANTNRRLQIVHQHLSHTAAPDPTRALTVAAASNTYFGEALRQLAHRVGGLDVLESLDPVPIPDEPFDWANVGDADREMVEAILERVDAVCTERLDVELRTIARRFLAIVMGGDLRPLRRIRRPERAAAAIVHAVLEGNGALGAQDVTIGRPWLFVASDIAWWFGVNSVAAAARALALAAPLPARNQELPAEQVRYVQLNSVALLHSKLRTRAIERREFLVQTYLEREAEQAARRAIVDRGDGSYSIRAVPAELAIVQRGDTDEGRSHVLLDLTPAGEASGLRFYALSIPEARQLQQLLGNALDGRVASLTRPSAPRERGGPSFWPR